MNAVILLTCALSGQDCGPSLLANNLNLTECMVQSQRIAAEYANGHPNRKIIRVICADHRRIDFYLGRGRA